MAGLSDRAIRTLADIEAFEREKPFEARVSARSVFDIFKESAAQYPDHVALTMLMTGAADETPRRSPTRNCSAGIIRAANFFVEVGGPGAGRSLHASRSGRDAYRAVGRGDRRLRGADQLSASGGEHRAISFAHRARRILVALGPHPQLDIWQKAVAVGKLLPGIKLVQVALSDAPLPEGAFNFGPSRMKAQDGSVLTSARREATMTSRPISTPAAPPVRRNWWPIPIVCRSRRRSVARCCRI